MKAIVSLDYGRSGLFYVKSSQVKAGQSRSWVGIGTELKGSQFTSISSVDGLLTVL